MWLLLWTVPYLVGGGILWFVLCRVAPVRSEITPGRTILAVVLMRVCELALFYGLRPLIGDWQLLVFVPASIVIVMLVLRLSWWRSTIAVFVYGFAVALITLGLSWIAERGTATPDAV